MRHVLALALAALAALALPSCGEDVVDPLHFSPDVLPEARVGVPYSATITVTNEQSPVGEISILGGELPQGLDLQYAETEDSAHVAGTPQEKGTYAFTVGAWCMGTNRRGQEGERVYAIEVLE